MDEYKGQFSIVNMSQTLGVSRSGYYRWRGRGLSKRALANKEFTQQIRPKWAATTDSGHGLPVAPNLLERNFEAEQLAQAWVSDITYLPSSGGWLYLTTIMDLADRQIIG